MAFSFQDHSINSQIDFQGKGGASVARSYGHMCHGQKLRFFGDKLIPPLIGNRYNGYIGAPTIGLMSLSPIICK